MSEQDSLVEDTSKTIQPQLYRGSETLEALMDDEPDEATDENPVPEEESTPSEAKDENNPSEDALYWKDRYDSLKGRYDQRVNELKALKDKLEKIENETAKIDANGVDLPSTPDEYAEFANNNPKLAEHLVSLAANIVEERTAALKEEVDQLKQVSDTTKKEKAMLELLKLQPDFEKTTVTKDFREWAEELTPELRNTLFESSDPKTVSSIINMYKSDRRLSTEVADKIDRKQEAAKEVSTKNSIKEQAPDDKPRFTSAQIASMSAEEFEANEQAIDLALKEGRIID